MVPWTHLREPPLWGKCLTELTSEFTHFNLVIRLSKVKQPAFLFCTVLRCPAAPTVLEFPVIGPFKWSCAEFQKPLFTAAAPAVDMHHAPWQTRQQACPFPAGVVSLVSGEVKHVVHLIRWNSYSRFMPIGARLDHGPRKGITHDFSVVRNWVLF